MEQVQDWWLTKKDVIQQALKIAASLCVHVDMDDIFVQVKQRRRPELQKVGKIAVHHYAHYIISCVW